jgi:integrase
MALEATMRRRTVSFFFRKDRNNAPTISWYEPDPNGNLVRRMQSFPTEKEARDARDLKEVEINGNSYSPKMGIAKWDVMVESFANFKKAKRKADNTIRDYKATLELFGQTCGYPSNNRLLPTSIETFATKYAISKKQHTYLDSEGNKQTKELDSDVSAHTVNKHIRNLRAFFNWLKKNKFIDFETKVEECEIDEVLDPRALDSEEVRILLNKIKEVREQKKGAPKPKLNDDIYCGVIIALYTGLRQKDVWNITLKNIDIEKGCFRNVWSYKCRMYIKHIPVPNECMQVVINYMTTHNRTGNVKLFESAFPRKRWENIQTCLPDFTFHCLRKTCATAMAEAGATPMQIQQWLGHYEFDTSDTYYIKKREAKEACTMPTSDWGLTG